MTRLDLRPPRSPRDPALKRYATRLSKLREAVATTEPTMASHRWRLHAIEGLLAALVDDLVRWRK